MTLDELTEKLRTCWTRQTSADPSWTKENPSLGQCAVTALIVQDHFGGDLLRVVNEGVSHYYNRLPDGTEVDLTRAQFDTWEPGPAEVRERTYVLSFAPTVHRYHRLGLRLARA